MKKIKMKDTILSHYQKVHELEMDGFAVRVFKPRTMQQLPSFQMLEWMKHRAHEAIRYMIMEQKAEWGMGNPDYGMWDAQVVYHYDPYRQQTASEKGSAQCIKSRHGKSVPTLFYGISPLP